LYNSGTTIDLTNCILDRNEVIGGMGSGNGGAGLGGGIYVDATSSLTM
jgi:hypothetical protein